MIYVIKTTLGAFACKIAVLMLLGEAHQFDWCILLVNQNKQCRVVDLKPSLVSDIILSLF